MILGNRNYFLQFTILLTITSFSEEFFLTKNRKKNESNEELKQKFPKEHVYYHRNDIGHLNEYYQERKKLRQEYDAIQKALEANETIQRDIDPNNTDYNLLNTNPLDLSEVEHSDQNIEPLVNNTNANLTGNQNSTTGIPNTEINLENNKYRRIGDCRGQIVYNQNIHITGGNYRATNGYLLEINFEGICVTCIEIKSKNDRDLKVKVISGGPGESKISLNFEELNKNFEFAYLLKIWGVGEKC
ncbi:myb-like protein O [Leptopilina heterotoma]|uniref:myb-like protein O n=1 Tax=Leptopilina heterotoma TaxID=63436 RepID=UPI001CA94935|nr:myb-like protein O [Leptopilina heterotoma]